MELEKYVTGYCRQLDGPRTVEVILENSRLTEADCAYGSCPYEANCPIGQQIQALEKEIS